MFGQMEMILLAQRSFTSLYKMQKGMLRVIHILVYHQITRFAFHACHSNRKSKTIETFESCIIQNITG